MTRRGAVVVEQVIGAAGTTMRRALTEHMLPLVVHGRMRFATLVAPRRPLAPISLVLVLARSNTQVLARRFPQLRLQGRNFPSGACRSRRLIHPNLAGEAFAA